MAPLGIRLKLSSTRSRSASSLSRSVPPEKPSGLTHRLTPTGATANERMVPAAALPAAPASTARARTRVVSSPAGSVPSSTVSNRTRPAVMHTVPAGMGRSVADAVSTLN